MIYIAKYADFKNIKSNYEELINEVNTKGYDCLIINDQAFSDEDKETFFHTMIEITSLLQNEHLILSSSFPAILISSPVQIIYNYSEHAPITHVL